MSLNNSRMNNYTINIHFLCILGLFESRTKHELNTNLTRRKHGGRIEATFMHNYSFLRLSWVKKSVFG